MFEKLSKKGVRGKMLKLIKGFYRRTTNEVIAVEGITDSLETGKWVRQGCPFSVTLFNIALDDVDDVWERGGVGVQ